MCRIALSLLLVASFTGVLAFDDQKVQEYIKFFESKGGFRVQDCKKSDLRKEDISFTFHSRERFISNVSINDLEAKQIAQSYCLPNRTTKILVHGWHGSATMKPIERMIMDYIWTMDVNVISMDWSAYSRKCNFESVARDVTDFCGEALADVIKYLVFHGALAKNFHVVAYGVGAHIAAVAGKLTQPQIGRITALEPTGLLFDYPRYPRLEKIDAELIDVIYTTKNHSSHRDLGHIVFYPEGGQHPQPKCENDSEMASAYKSIAYFRRSIVTPQAYPAKRITEDFSGPRPEPETGEATYTADNYMGEYVDPCKQGKYYVNMKTIKPFNTELSTLEV